MARYAYTKKSMLHMLRSGSKRVKEALGQAGVSEQLVDHLVYLYEEERIRELWAAYDAERKARAKLGQNGMQALVAPTGLPERITKS